jgi:putative Mg2+ transporter-C (MgtC) family protein
MAQGIMTGIGFLGAGVIFKDGLSVRGLTTAASIWVTAAIGVLIGIGFYLPAVLATVLTLGTLSVFRWVEQAARTTTPHHAVALPRARCCPKPSALMRSHGFTIANMSYRAVDEDQDFEYRMVLHDAQENLAELAAALRARDDVCAFRLSPTGD